MKMVEHDYKHFLGVLRPIDRAAIEAFLQQQTLAKITYFPKYTGDSISFFDAVKEVGTKNITAANL